MSHEAQLYLAVVGREELLSLVCDECLAHLLARLIAHGDVLQVRVTAGEAARGGDRLVEGGVDVARVGTYEQGQGIDVRAEEFLQSPVFQYLTHDGMLGPQ